MDGSSAADSRLIGGGVGPTVATWRGGTIIGALFVCAAACGPTPAKVRVIEPVPPGQLVLYVTAARQRISIERSLQAAGFAVADRPRPDTYLLRVTLGLDQRSRPCGTLNNVRYALRRDQRTLVEVEAKGWTGTCVPNVFDDASRALREQIVGAPAREEDR